MSIVDKLTFEETDLSKSLLETERLAAIMLQVLGEESAANIQTSPGDELVDLLMSIRRAINGPPEDIRRAVTTIDEAIELCFLHSEAYTAAFELFKLEKSGRLVSDATAREIIYKAMEQAEGRNNVSVAEVETSRPKPIRQPDDENDSRQAQNCG